MTRREVRVWLQMLHISPNSARIEGVLNYSVIELGL